jgi:hypothetical protein
MFASINYAKMFYGKVEHQVCFFNKIKIFDYANVGLDSFIVVNLCN